VLKRACAQARGLYVCEGGWVGEFVGVLVCGGVCEGVYCYMGVSVCDRGWVGECVGVWWCVVVCVRESIVIWVCQCVIVGGWVGECVGVLVCDGVCQ